MRVEVAMSHAVKFASARDALMDMLADGLWHDWRDLRDRCGVRYGARIFEARELGWLIESESLETGSRYRLAGFNVDAFAKRKQRLLLAAEDIEALADGTVTDAVRGEAQRVVRR